MSVKKGNTQCHKKRAMAVGLRPGLTRAEIEAIDAELRKHPELMPTTGDMEHVMRRLVAAKARLERSPQKGSAADPRFNSKSC